MKKVIISALATFALVVSGAMIELPPPEKSGGMPLADALNMRRSVRTFKKDALTAQQLSNILWSANGISSPDGKRTAPSARNRQDVMIFVTCEQGSFFYDAAKHALVKVSGADLRRASGRYSAPVYLLLVSDTSKMKDAVYAALDTGYVSQNIYLAATAAKLGTCAMGMIVDRNAIIRELKLGNNRLMLSHPVGVPR